MAWDSERPNELWLGYRERPNELLIKDPSLLVPEALRYASHPGGHTEGFPDTFLQAWADGVPSVSFVDCGARLDGQPVGIRVATQEEMHRQVEQLASSEDRRMRAGLVCRNYVEQHHSEEVVLDVYEKLFSELLDRDLQMERREGRWRRSVTSKDRLC